MGFKSFLSTQSTEDLVPLWNEVCEYGDDYIYSGVESISEVFSEPLGFARAVYFGDVQNWADEYAAFNGYGNIVTFNYWDDKNSPIDLDTLTEWLERDNHAVYQNWLEEQGDEE